MEFAFSPGWLFGGIAIMIAGAIFIRFHQWIADNFGGGVGSYERYKLYGLIAIGAGFLAALHLLPMFMTLIVHTLFGGGKA